VLQSGVTLWKEKSWHLGQKDLAFARSDAIVLVCARKKQSTCCVPNVIHMMPFKIRKSNLQKFKKIIRRTINL